MSKPIRTMVRTKVLPDLMGQRIRITMGHVFYFAVPPADTCFSHPHMPSHGVPGCTGWPVLPPDDRGFRVRTGGRAPGRPRPVRSLDRARVPRPAAPDPRAALSQPRRGAHQRDPGLPLREQRRRQFHRRHPPRPRHVWHAGGGSAEAFKFGPVLGDYIAHRVLDDDREPELADGFRRKQAEFDSR